MLWMENFFSPEKKKENFADGKIYDCAITFLLKFFPDTDEIGLIKVGSFYSRWN